jgi:hypothetical protein
MARKTLQDKTGVSAIRLKIRRKLTVNDILARDDLNEFLADMEQIKPNIKHAIIIWVDREDNYSWEMTEGIPTSQAVWLLEKTKLDILMPDIRGEEE